MRVRLGYIWRSKHNWYCLGLENRSRESVCRFESCFLRHIGVSSNGRIAVSKIVNGGSSPPALAMSAECGGDETRACPEVLVEPLPKVCGVQIKRG